ncbi:hypothetical protein [Candidatus Nitrotoga arctica]|uniref:Uncharacterized protein n=1 Tax=Candidatus Nitrotoga arctica TaxID=453162 RepID=A0ABM8YW17_9PROT|nr:hypothetical protein [Candidatus Nitrotoga arctica]CAG9931711.1 protein of unknown function [Candidatus Nitrotoga arctica]
MCQTIINSIANRHVGFNLARWANSDITEVGKLNPAELSSTETLTKDLPEYLKHPPGFFRNFLGGT